MVSKRRRTKIKVTGCKDTEGQTAERGTDWAVKIIITQNYT